jgi:hypothetical protein
VQNKKQGKTVSIKNQKGYFNMAVKSENKRATVTLNPLQQAELTKLAKKYAVSESKVLAHGLDLLIMQENAHFKTGLEKCPH